MMFSTKQIYTPVISGACIRSGVSRKEIMGKCDFYKIMTLNACFKFSCADNHRSRLKHPPVLISMVSVCVTQLSYLQGNSKQHITLWLFPSHFVPVKTTVCPASLCGASWRGVGCRVSATYQFGLMATLKALHSPHRVDAVKWLPFTRPCVKGLWAKNRCSLHFDETVWSFTECCQKVCCCSWQ